MAIPKYQDILSLHLKGVSNLKIAKTCGCSRTTVISTIKAFKCLDLNSVQIETMTDLQLKEALYPKRVKEKGNVPDVKIIERELGQDKNVTLKLLWKEYLTDSAEKKIAPLMYSRFCHYYQQYAATRRVSGHVERESGFSAEVDWSGSTMQWRDIRSEEIFTAYLFVACLSFSRYTFCEAFPSEDMDCWITAHNDMFRFFNGCPKIIICDNLKTGVVKHRKGETRINRTYQELARHYHTVISPAAVRHAKGKPNVEDSVGIISNNIVAALRHHVFYSLADMNQAIKEKLEAINGSPFQKREGSRKQLFEQVECTDLQPLPSTPFELADWHTGLTVQYNYHLRVGKWFSYSVPYQYVGRKVSARVTTRVVEIFLNDHRIATHERNYDRRRPYRTEISHMPTEQQESKATWNERRLLSWAGKIGPNTRTIVTGIFNSRQVVQQAYPACMALLNLSKTYGDGHLEKVCAQLVDGKFSPSLTNVKNLLAATSKPQQSENKEKSSPPPGPKGLLRQPPYFHQAVEREAQHD